MLADELAFAVSVKLDNGKHVANKRFEPPVLSPIPPDEVGDDFLLRRQVVRPFVVVKLVD